jgi:hypothetical protein
MSREASLLRILAANANIQKHVSIMLEAKANELAKSRSWACCHLKPHTYEDHVKQLKEPLKLHEQIVEVLDGLTKVENGLGRHLGLLIGSHEDASEFEGMGGTGGFNMGGMFDLGGDLK